MNEKFLLIYQVLDKLRELETMVHMDTRGHSGLFATMGKGAMLNVAKKLGMVTISSTETEVVSTGERLPKCTWFRYMRLAQGEEMSEDVLMQDNKSTIL